MPARTGALEQFDWMPFLLLVSP